MSLEFKMTLLVHQLAMDSRSRDEIKSDRDTSKQRERYEGDKSYGT